MNSQLNDREVATLVAMILGKDDPDDYCAFILIGVEHPSNMIHVAHSAMPKTAAAKLTLQTAGKLAEMAAERGEIVMYPIKVEMDGEVSHFADTGITPREALALDEENTGSMDARLDAILDRFAEAEYRRNMEGK